MTSPTLPKLIFGSATIAANSGFPTIERLEELLEVLWQEGVMSIDTAQICDDTETMLGQANAASRFSIDTKHCGGIIPGESTCLRIISRAEECLSRLKVKKLGIFYLHAPDSKIPLEETLSGVNGLFLNQKFTRFGLSNFDASEVEEVIQVSRKNDFVQPTVFQGNYNPISRRPETELFPILRKHGIAFHAYSPIAGGFLAKTKKQIVQGECTGRWNPNSSIGGLYHALYNKPKYLQALDVWADISASSGIERAELAYRWMAYHSYIETSLGDAIVIGASSIPQLERTLAGLRNGPLPVDVVKQIDEIWTLVENESVLDNFSPFRSSIR